MFCGLVGGSALHLQPLVFLFSCCPLKGLLESRRPRKRLLGELSKLLFWAELRLAAGEEEKAQGRRSCFCFGFRSATLLLDPVCRDQWSQEETDEEEEEEQVSAESGPREDEESEGGPADQCGGGGALLPPAGECGAGYPSRAGCGGMCL